MASCCPRVDDEYQQQRTQLLRNGRDVAAGQIELSDPMMESLCRLLYGPRQFATQRLAFQTEAGLEEGRMGPARREGQRHQADRTPGSPGRAMVLKISHIRTTRKIYVRGDRSKAGPESHDSF